MKDSPEKNKMKKKHENTRKVKFRIVFSQKIHKYEDLFKSRIQILENKDKKFKTLSTFTIWHIFPIIALFIILLLLTIYNVVIKQQMIEIAVLPAIPSEISQYPFVKQQYAPSISAESAIILDDTSKVVLYEKKPLLRFSMASTTKIMTALVALEYFQNNNVITIQNIHEEGAILGFSVGEKLFFEDLLYAMLLPSANDAAYAIAENYPGGIDAFVAKMNQKAAELGLHYTHYVDPAGLEDDGNYTTVSDLAHLSSYIIHNEEFKNIIATKQKTISTIDGSKSYQLKNLNKLLGENGVVGIKTGFTEGAGEVLVTAKIEKNHLFIIIVMKSQDRFADTETLLRYINNNVMYINPQVYLLDKKPL
jgi:D-alanyl-D-alanine carboxypeptidase